MLCVRGSSCRSTVSECGLSEGVRQSRLWDSPGLKCTVLRLGTDNEGVVAFADDRPVIDGGSVRFT